MLQMSKHCLPHACHLSQIAVMVLKLTFQVTNPVNYENGQNLHSISVLYHTQETLTQKLYQNKHGWKVAWHNFD